MSEFCPRVPTCAALTSLQDSCLNQVPYSSCHPYMVRTHKLHKKMHVRFESAVTAVLQVPGRELISFQDSDALGLWVLLRSTEAQRPKAVIRFLGAQLRSQTMAVYGSFTLSPMGPHSHGEIVPTHSCLLSPRLAHVARTAQHTSPHLSCFPASLPQPLSSPSGVCVFLGLDHANSIKAPDLISHRASLVRLSEFLSLRQLNILAELRDPVVTWTKRASISWFLWSLLRASFLPVSEKAPDFCS